VRFGQRETVWLVQSIGARLDVRGAVRVATSAVAPVRCGFS